MKLQILGREVTAANEPYHFYFSIKRDRPANRMDTRAYQKNILKLKERVTADLKAARAWILDQLSDGSFSQIPQKRTDLRPTNHGGGE